MSLRRCVVTGVVVIAVVGCAVTPGAAISFRSQTSGWMGPGTTPGNVWTAQLDLDPQLEIILVDGDPSAYVYILDGLNLTLEAESPPSGHGTAAGISSSLSDIDADGELELMVGFAEAGASHTVIFDTDTGASITSGDPTRVSATPALAQSRPNPLVLSAAIQYEIPRQEAVTLRVLDVQGRVVRTLLDGELAGAGSHEVVWDGTNDKGARVASGQYYYQIVTPDGVGAKKLIVLR